MSSTRIRLTQRSTGEYAVLRRAYFSRAERDARIKEGYSPQTTFAQDIPGHLGPDLSIPKKLKRKLRKPEMQQL